MSKNSDARIVIIGCGSKGFGLGTMGDLMGFQGLEGATVVLNDISEEMVQLVGGVAKKAMEEASIDGDDPPYRIESYNRYKRSLTRR